MDIIEKKYLRTVNREDLYRMISKFVYNDFKNSSNYIRRVDNSIELSDIVNDIFIKLSTKPYDIPIYKVKSLTGGEITNMVRAMKTKIKKTKKDGNFNIFFGDNAIESNNILYAENTYIEDEY